MEKQSIIFMNLITLLSVSMMSASNFSHFDGSNLKLPKQPYKKHTKKNRQSLSASVLMPKQAATFKIDTSLSQATVKPAQASSTIAAAALLAPQIVSSSDSSSSSSNAQKTVFAGFWSTRYRPMSYATNLWYVPTYKRALTEAESYDHEKQTWQNDESSQEFIATALKSFKKHNVPAELKNFLLLAKNKHIPLPPLDDTQTWLREIQQSENDQKINASNCLSVIGMLEKKADNI